eukprot:scaffold4697_cov172-Alexandrium_tamarense.AAC.1
MLQLQKEEEEAAKAVVAVAGNTNGDAKIGGGGRGLRSSLKSLSPIKSDANNTQSDNNTTTRQSKPPTSSSTTTTNYTRSPSATAFDQRNNTPALFIPMSHNDQVEMIELLRRVAELVVVSERRAARIMGRMENENGGKDGDGRRRRSVGDNTVDGGG